MRYVVIVAGGAGTRLWPLSRKGTPKQLLPLLEDRSLLRIAFDRATGVVDPANIVVCTGAAYADEVAAELPEIPTENILGEPIGRDSLNAMAWPTAVLAARDRDAVIAVLTADHIISPVEEFQASVAAAFTLAETRDDLLLTFGIVPTRPHTGYGYLHRGEPLGDVAYSVQEFREKPDLATAQAYLDTGEYWWNSGMFVWRATTFLDQLHRLVPVSHRIVTEIAAHPGRVSELFGELPKISVDYAIMEPVSHGHGSAQVAALPLTISWEDVGGYLSLASLLEVDAAGNASQGLTTLLEAGNNLVINRDGDHLVAVVGLDDHIVVHTPAITVACPKHHSERIKELVAQVAAEHGERWT